ncbi:putative BAH domain, RNA-binding domain superfamily [Dioscorea sansibarensis]
MSHLVKLGNNDLSFHWGRKRGLGGTKRNVQFYESFTFDNVEYCLYDCVYLFKKGENDAYIGKIVKIWEQSDHKKRVKILWFFRPCEIQNYLRDYSPLEKEIFLASGKGVGLTNINPLEAIAGKCHVVCTSVDKRNLQPSSTDVELADYIFYHVFDVGNYTISDVLADTIAGIEVKFLLNQRKNLKPASGSKVDANGIFDDQKDAFDDLHGHCKSASPKSLENQVNKDSSATAISPLPIDGVNEGNCDVEKPKYSTEDQANPTLSDEKLSKKRRLIDEAFKSSGASQKDKVDTCLRKRKVEHGDIHSCPLQREPTEKGFSEKRAKLSHEPLQKASLACSVQNDEKADSQSLEVIQRPNADRSKWFKGLSWDLRIKKAHEVGTLVLLSNVDPSYTSSDVENIIYNAFDLSCTAKVIPHSMFQDPNYGEAYVIFKARDMADLVVRKINNECLMQENGRPLICSKGLLKMPSKPSTSSFTGHLVIDKVRLQMQRDEMRKAVSTSHCSQPNTIEYEMALEWMLAQEKSAASLNLLNKVHSDEIRQVRRRA